MVSCMLIPRSALRLHRSKQCINCRKSSARNDTNDAGHTCSCQGRRRFHKARRNEGSTSSQCAPADSHPAVIMRGNALCEEKESRSAPTRS